MNGGKIVALAGGVGGAKLAHGLAQIDARALTVIVNTGDGFEHLGLHVCPDIDTVLYTLSGLANHAQGWGLEGESWAFMDQLKKFDAPRWFLLGDRDIATHLLRTMRLRAGERLTCIVGDFAAKLGLPSTILPMSDDPVRTMVGTPEGELAFQDYFVRLRCDVPVTGFRLAGIETAMPNPAALNALESPDLTAILICPSNPYVSINPILSVKGMKVSIKAAKAPVVAVSPIIGGAAVKGPAAKMMKELGQDVSALGVARCYAGVIDGFVIDEADRALEPAIAELGMKVSITDTLMRDDADRKRLAEHCLAFAAEVGRT